MTYTDRELRDHFCSYAHEICGEDCPAIACLLAQLSAVQNELKECGKYATEQYKGYEEKIAALTHRNQKLREALEKIVIDTGSMSAYEVAKLALAEKGKA